MKPFTSISFSVAIGSIAMVSLLASCSKPPFETHSSRVNPQANGHNLIPNQFQLIRESNDIPVATRIIDCNAIQPNQKIHIREHSKLSASCDLTNKSVRFIIDASNSSLDCRGANISQAGSKQSGSAITIKPKQNHAIDNITVANCHVQGYGHALHIRQKTKPNTRYLKGLTSLADNKKTAPHNIRIFNLSSNGSKNSGIFLGDHVYDVHFSHLHIRASGTVGLYFEFGSQNNLVENSVFSDNGFRMFKPNREAIAIDSSANNIIKNNTFIHNGAGSIFLYRNCFEHAQDKSRSNHFKRTQSSDNNVISHNVFNNETVGIWVASRQSRDLSGFNCGAYLMKETASASYHLDSAKNNLIKLNTMIDVAQGVIVEDDNNQVIENNFINAGGIAIEVGSPIREQTKYGPIKNTQISNNQFPPAVSSKSLMRISKMSVPYTLVDE